MSHSSPPWRPLSTTQAMIPLPQIFNASTPKFARVFHSGFGVIFAAIYAISKDPTMEKLEKDSEEYAIRKNLVIFYLITFFGFLATFCLKSYYNIVNRKYHAPRHQKLSDLRIGVVGLLICELIEVACCIYMNYNEGAGYQFVVIAHAAAIILMGSFVLEQSYLLKLPKKYVTIHMCTLAVAVVAGICMLFKGGQIGLCRAGFIPIIECLLVDGYILFFRSSEIHFLGDYIEKRVVCKDKEGNEWRGRFASVSHDHQETLYLRLKLTNVEKLRNGKYVEHPGIVYIDEIESLKLAEVESTDKKSIEKCAKCQKKKKTA